MLNSNELKEKLFSKQGTPFLGAKQDDETVYDFCNHYMTFLDKGKTEREAALTAVEFLSQKGFTEFVPGTCYRKGEKVYWFNHKKSVLAAVIGSEPFENGFLVVAAHIDSPRLDVKPRPLYEEASLAFFKTHYYGGVKKYQWTAIPLSMHGTVILSDGSEVILNIGEDENDPVLYITDLLPHLARKSQGNKTMPEIITGEQLNVLLGSIPMEDVDKDAVKLNILRLLNEKYGMTEDDLISAEIEIVPAFHARYAGLDRSFVAAYGQDDRVCGYTAMRALTELENPSKTCLLVLADKEEIGSIGNTGLSSDMLRHFISMLCSPHEVAPEVVMIHSKCLSADVNVAYDPNFPEVYEKRNSAFMNCGPILSKYTGQGGKSTTNDASAEMIGEIRRAFDSESIPWQIAELGKVDEGGGGTVARFISLLGIDTIDIGVGILSMHSPYELSSCYDIFALYRALRCFYSKL